MQAEPKEAKVHAEDKAQQSCGLKVPALTEAPEKLLGSPTVCHPSCGNGR